jgi:hypothetical protein
MAANTRAREDRTREGYAGPAGYRDVLMRGHNRAGHVQHHQHAHQRGDRAQYQQGAPEQLDSTGVGGGQIRKRHATTPQPGGGRGQSLGDPLVPSVGEHHHAEEQTANENGIVTRPFGQLSQHVSDLPLRWWPRPRRV